MQNFTNHTTSHQKGYISEVCAAQVCTCTYIRTYLQLSKHIRIRMTNPRYQLGEGNEVLVWGKMLHHGLNNLKERKLRHRIHTCMGNSPYFVQLLHCFQSRFLLTFFACRHYMIYINAFKKLIHLLMNKCLPLSGTLHPKSSHNVSSRGIHWYRYLQPYSSAWP